MRGNDADRVMDQHRALLFRHTSNVLVLLRKNLLGLGGSEEALYVGRSPWTT